MTFETIRPVPKTENKASVRGPVVVALAVAIGFVVLLALLPGELLFKLTLLNSGICPQRPDHSYFLDGQSMPLEARMAGIFAGYALTLAVLWLVGRGRALLWPPKLVSLLLLGMIGLMVGDGFNSTAYDLGWTTPYPPQNWLRLLTGLLSGIGMAGLILPAFTQMIWRQGYTRGPFRRVGEVGALLVPAGGLFLGTIAGWSLIFWLVSGLAVTGVVAMLVMFNWLILVVLLRRENRVNSPAEFIGPAVMVTLLSLGQLAIFSILRLTFAGIPASLLTF